MVQNKMSDVKENHTGSGKLNLSHFPTSKRLNFDCHFIVGYIIYCHGLTCHLKSKFARQSITK